MKLRVIIAVLIICIAVSLFAEHPIKRKLCVMDIKTGGATEGISQILTDRLMLELAKTNRFNIVERERRNEILKEQGFSLSGVTEDAPSLVKLGKWLAVSKVVSGSVGLVGEVWIVNILIVDISTGKVEDPMTKNITGKVNGVLDYMKYVALNLSAREKQVEDAWLNDSISISKTILNYDKGIKAYEAQKTKITLDYQKDSAYICSLTEKQIDKNRMLADSLSKLESTKGQDTGTTKIKKTIADLNKQKENGILNLQDLVLQPVKNKQVYTSKINDLDVQIVKLVKDRSECEKQLNMLVAPNVIDKQPTVNSPKNEKDTVSVIKPVNSKSPTKKKR
jgi:hypothetical protein